MELTLPLLISITHPILQSLARFSWNSSTSLPFFFHAVWLSEIVSMKARSSATKLNFSLFFFGTELKNMHHLYYIHIYTYTHTKLTLVLHIYTHIHTYIYTHIYKMSLLLFLPSFLPSFSVLVNSFISTCNSTFSNIFLLSHSEGEEWLKSCAVFSCLLLKPQQAGYKFLFHTRS